MEAQKYSDTFQLLLIPGFQEPRQGDIKRAAWSCPTSWHEGWTLLIRNFNTNNDVVALAHYGYSLTWLHERLLSCFMEKRTHMGILSTF